MNKKILFALPLALLAFLVVAPLTRAQESLTPQRGVATGSTNIQGYSFDGDEGTLTFYNVGQMLADSRYSKAVLSVNDAEWTGTFTGGPEGTAHFVTELGADIDIKLTGGRSFDLDRPGAWIHLTVTNPSIFEPDEETPEEAAPEEEAAPGEPAVDSGARMSDISGQLEIACPPNLDSWDVMKMGRIIYVNCLLKTGEDSAAVISFSDMTTFKMKAESIIVIDTPPQKDSKLKLLAGNIWVNVKQMIKDGTMTVHGSQAVAGIKGTTFILTENGSITGVKVIEGVVNFKSTVDGKSVDVNPGEWLEADKDGLKTVTTFDIDAENKAWGIPTAQQASPAKKESGGSEFVKIVNPATINDNANIYGDVSFYWFLTPLLFIIIGLVLFISLKKLRK